MIVIKIGIISDTHISKHFEKIDKMIDRYFKEVDMIIHLGDYTSLEVIKRIKKKKKFIGVWGNNDGSSIREVLKEKEIVSINHHKIGLYHGHGNSKVTMERAYEIFKKDKVDIIVFGHSHQPIIKTKNKILMLNPGSLTKKSREPYYSYIILELEKSKIDARIVFL